MSSENRSSSAVRNLRSIFENKASLGSDSPDSRGRSPSGRSSDKENGYLSTNKVRASFVPVEPVRSMPALEKQQSTVEVRRGSFSEVNGHGELSALKKIVSDEQDNRLVPEGAIESAVGSTVVTPIKELSESQMGHWNPAFRPNGEGAPADPDKPVSGAEDEPGGMKPAEPSSEEVASGGAALPPVTKDLRPSTKPTLSPAAKKVESTKPASNGKPAAISTKKSAHSTIKSPATQPKTPSSAKVSSSSKTASPIASTLKEPLRKASRSSLTAPTAASIAHSKAPSDKSSSSKSPPASRSKPRESTKPVNLSSHLTAPTASSKAKHDANATTTTATSTHNSHASTNSRPKQSSSTRPTPRSSLAAQQRPKSRESNITGRRSLAPAGSSFLERMTKPTASSASKAHEKVETKSPPRTKASAARPKVNGTTSKSKGMTGSPSKTKANASSQSNGSPAAIGGALEKSALAEATGNEIPIPHANGTANEVLEATTAGLGGEETIR